MRRAGDDVLDRLILGAVSRRESTTELVADIAEGTTAASRHEGNPAGHSCCFVFFFAGYRVWEMEVGEREGEALDEHAEKMKAEFCRTFIARPVLPLPPGGGACA